MSRQPGTSASGVGPQPRISPVETVVSPSGRGISLAGEPTQLVADRTVATDSGPFADTGRGAVPSVKAPVTGSADTLKEIRRETTVLPLVELRGEQVELVRKSNARYETIKELGRGGMGEVSLVRDNDIGRTVALKRLNRPPSNDPSALLRFISEVRTVGQLEHPNIVPIHDVGLDENGNYYFVMKYVDGETLEHIIHKLADGDPYYHSRYPVEVRLEIFMGLLRALQYAHDQGIVHRDPAPPSIPSRNDYRTELGKGSEKQCRTSADGAEVTVKTDAREATSCVPLPSTRPQAA